MGDGGSGDIWWKGVAGICVHHERFFLRKTATPLSDSFPGLICLESCAGCGHRSFFIFSTRHHTTGPVFFPSRQRSGAVRGLLHDSESEAEDACAGARVGHGSGRGAGLRREAQNTRQADEGRASEKHKRQADEGRTSENHKTDECRRSASPCRARPRDPGPEIPGTSGPTRRRSTFRVAPNRYSTYSYEHESSFYDEILFLSSESR